MLGNITKTVGSAMATLCLTATLAIAQTPMTPQTGNTTPQQGHRQGSSTERQMQKTSEGERMRLTCTKDDGKGNCTAATGANGKEFVVNGEGLKSGATMSCIDRGSVVDCAPAS
jgi:hypothetical protein